MVPYALVLPFVLIMCFIFLGGIFQAIVQSFGYLPAFGMNVPTLRYYGQVLSDTRFTGSLFHTFYIAIVASSLSVIMGVIIAFAINRTPPGRGFSHILYKSPIILPHLVVVVLVFHIFSQTGIISRFLFNLGLVNDPNNFPLMVYDRYSLGIMLVYLYKQIPFVSLTVLTVLKNLDRKYVQIAANLGAGKWQTLRMVTLPLLGPSIISAFLITFAFDFGSFEVPFILGSPARLTLPVLAYFDYASASLDLRPAAMVANVIISVISLALIWLYVVSLRFFTRRGLEGKVL